MSRILPFACDVIFVLQLVLLELLRVLGHRQVVYHVLNVAIHEALQVVDGVSYAVVGDPSLRIVVGAYLCRAVASGDKRFASVLNVANIFSVFTVVDESV